MKNEKTKGIKKNTGIRSGLLMVIITSVFLSACGGCVQQRYPERDLKTATRLIIAKATTEEEKLEGLFLFVRDEIDFNWAYPQDIPPENVLKNGYGVCMQKANLLSAMAKEVGFQTRFRFILVHKQALEDFLPAYAYKNWADPFPHTVVEVLIQGEWRSFDPSFDGKLQKICLNRKINFARYPEIAAAYKTEFSIEGMKGTQEFWKADESKPFYGDSLEPLIDWDQKNNPFFKRLMKPLIFRQAKGIMNEFRK